MKTYIKTVFYAIAISVAILACNNANNEYENLKKGISCKQSNSISTVISYDELDPSCKNEQKRLIRISEMHWEETDLDYIGGDIAVRRETDTETGEFYFIVNDKKMSEKEYYEFEAEWNRKYYEQLKGKRNLPIPCVVSDDAVGWVALLTDKDVSELMEKYGELAFRDYAQPNIDGEVGACH